MRTLLAPFYTPFPLRALAALVLAVVTILGALGSQFLLGFEPCELCYWQRWPYYIGIPILGLVLALWSRIPVRPRIVLTLLVALIFVVSIGLASYHAGIEYKLWPGPSSCTGLGDQLAFSDLNNLGAAERSCPATWCSSPSSASRWRASTPWVRWSWPVSCSGRPGTVAARARRGEIGRSRSAALRLQLGIPVEIVHPALVQVVGREGPPVVVQVVDGRPVGRLERAACRCRAAGGCPSSGCTARRRRRRFPRWCGRRASAG